MFFRLAFWSGIDVAPWINGDPGTGKNNKRIAFWISVAPLKLFIIKRYKKYGNVKNVKNIKKNQKLINVGHINKDLVLDKKFQH